MHLRRALLLMALVLAVAATVQALVPVPPQRTAPPPSPPVRAPVTASAPATQRVVSFRYPPAGRSPQAVKVPLGAHVAVVVSSSEAGQASLAGLGEVQPVEPGTPARFDLLLSGAGRYEVTLEPVSAQPLSLGTLVVSGSGRRP